MLHLFKQASWGEQVGACERRLCRTGLFSLRVADMMETGKNRKLWLSDQGVVTTYSQ